MGLGANPISPSAPRSRRTRWLPDLVAGRALGAFGLTEPDGGSDAGATRTHAPRSTSGRRVGDRRVEGVHHQLRHADHVARHRDGPHRRGRDLGLRGARRHARAGRGARLPQAGLARVRHPRPDARRVPGARRTTCSARRARVPQLPRRSSTTAASPSPRWPSAAPRRASTTRSTTPSERNAFGGPIGRYQAIAFALADLAVAVENARNLTYKAAWLKEHGRPFARPRPWPSCTPPRPPSTPTRTATQVFGGYGFMEETPVARFYRDAKILEIGEGTSEIQRLVIARDLGSAGDMTTATATATAITAPRTRTGRPATPAASTTAAVAGRTTGGAPRFAARWTAHTLSGSSTAGTATARVADRRLMSDVPTAWSSPRPAPRRPRQAEPNTT